LSNFCTLSTTSSSIFYLHYIYILNHPLLLLSSTCNYNFVHIFPTLHQFLLRMLVLQSVLVYMRNFCTLSTTIFSIFYLHYIYILNHLLYYFSLQLATTFLSIFFLQYISTIFNFFLCHYKFVLFLPTITVPTCRYNYVNVLLFLNLPLQYRPYFSTYFSLTFRQCTRSKYFDRKKLFRLL
jgi:hypothetical protein